MKDPGHRPPWRTGRRRARKPDRATTVIILAFILIVLNIVCGGCVANSMSGQYRSAHGSIIIHAVSRPNRKLGFLIPWFQPGPDASPAVASQARQRAAKACQRLRPDRCRLRKDEEMPPSRSSTGRVMELSNQYHREVSTP